MILKIKENDSWTYLDNITRLTVVMENELSKSGWICYTRNGEILSQEVSSGCYVLNDTGKTIERLF